MHFDIDCAKINCRDPALVGFETEPHDASDDMGVDKDKEGVVHNLHEGLVFDRDRQFANFLQDFLETLHFQKRHYVCEQKVNRIRVHTCSFSDLIERESWQEVNEEWAMENILFGYHFWLKNLPASCLFVITWHELQEDIEPENCVDETIYRNKDSAFSHLFGSVERNSQRSPEGVPDGQCHDQVLKVVQRSILSRINYVTAFYSFIFFV